MGISLDEWIEENCSGLDEEIKTHLEAMLGSVTTWSEREDVVRLIMISVRQWDQLRRKK